MNHTEKKDMDIPDDRLNDYRSKKESRRIKFKKLREKFIKRKNKI